MNKRYFRRYWRTIGIFTVWLFLVAYVFGAAKEALNSLNILISLIVLIGMEYGLGFGQDKRVIRSNQRKIESDRQRRESMGETEWNEYQIKNKRIAEYRKNLMWKAVFLDLVMGTAYMTGLGLTYGKDPKWLRDAIPALLWFLMFFLVLAAWIISFPKRMREGKIFIWEVLFVAPFMVFPFFPLISDWIVCGFTAFTGGTIFSVLAIGYMRQTRKKEKVCTVMTTAKVIDNIKSTVHLERPGDIPIYAYQPVLEYGAGGERQQVICGDGEPSPYPLDEVYTIYYNPENPEEFRFADHRPAAERLIGPVFLGIGIVLLAGAVGIWGLT